MVVVKSRPLIFTNSSQEPSPNFLKSRTVPEFPRPRISSELRQYAEALRFSRLDKQAVIILVPPLFLQQEDGS